MAFVPAPNIVQCEILFTLDGQQVENRINIDALTAPDATVIGDIAAAVDEWVIGNYLPRLPVEAVYRGVQATDLSEQNGQQVTVTPETELTGDVTGGAMPNEVTLAIQLKSTSRGRSARGRAFVIALPRTTVTDNTVSSTHVNNLIASFEQLLTNIGDGGWAVVVVSYIANGAPRVGGPVYFVVSSCTVADNIVDSMRSRKPGVGT